MPKILVVEDEPAIAESLAYSLRRDGFTVTVAPTLAAAEREAFGGSGGAPPAPVDLVVLDLMLPDGSGFDLIGQIRRRGLGTAIIVLSSRDGEADRVAALETGADDYVTKPFSPREIVARVRAVLRRAGATAGGQRRGSPPRRRGGRRAGRCPSRWHRGDPAGHGPRASPMELDPRWSSTLLACSAGARRGGCSPGPSSSRSGVGTKATGSPSRTAPSTRTSKGPPCGRSPTPAGTPGSSRRCAGWATG